MPHVRLFRWSLFVDLTLLIGCLGFADSHICVAAKSLSSASTRQVIKLAVLVRAGRVNSHLLIYSFLKLH